MKLHRPSVSFTGRPVKLARRPSRIRDTIRSTPLVAAKRAELDEGMTERCVEVGVGAVSFDDVVTVARGGAGVRLAPEALAAIDRARAVVEELAAAPTPAYGVSTGFGALATRHIAPELRTQLQRSLVRSHAAGSGS